MSVSNNVQIILFLLIFIGSLACPDPDNQFQCENGDCIDKVGRCNTISNCVDGSDERNCSTCVNINEFPKPFHCKPTLQCLSHSLVCNNQVDCLDGSDKVECHTHWYWWLVGVLCGIYVWFTLCTLCVVVRVKPSLLLHIVKTFFFWGTICQCYSSLATIFRRCKDRHNYPDTDGDA